nr:alanine--tRNA ligase [Acidilobus saccharovorans]
MPIQVNPSEYRLPFFKEQGYQRKQCRVGGDFFWTLNASFDTCQDVPDTDYWFDRIPSVPGLTVAEARRKFIDFFARHGHTPIQPRPVVARWREDLYLTIASIVDFQPHVTSGLVPPPANPLVISQPCIRLEDIDNVGLTIGRHLTTFEMAAHHAFNYPDKQVYWKDETVRYAYEFFTKELGIPGDLIVFKESWWEGGGNAGPSFEVTVGGLELATLVFMQYKIDENGNYVELPLKIVDTGYGVERMAWFTQKTPTAFHAIYGQLLDKARSELGLPRPPEEYLWAAFRAAAKFNPDVEGSLDAFYQQVSKTTGAPLSEVRQVLEREARLYSVLDHSKTIAMMLGDGVVPSNSGEGYLARLVIRRALRQLRLLNENYDLAKIVDMQIDLWGSDFPQLKENRSYIIEAVGLEEDRYKDLLRRGEKLVLRELSQGASLETLIKLYDSYGIPPEVAAEAAAKKGITVLVPRNFYSLVAARHRAPAKVRSIEEKSSLPEDVVSWARQFKPTELLFHKDPYARSFTAKILGVKGEYVVLDSTIFYATGGGQLNDVGVMEICGERYNVVDVQKAGDVIVHKLDRAVDNASCGEARGEIDWVRRFRLMRHHTATHIILGAARRVLGNHVWQAGAEKTPEKARLDITHHKPLTREEVRRIEELANRVIDERRPVLQAYMDRNEAESKYGFVLYEGGVPMERKIRVVEVQGWDVEACFGTHVTNTGDIGGIKIINVEKIQDGVVRLEFVAGTRVPEEMAALEDRMTQLSSELGSQGGEELNKVKELKDELMKLKESVKAYRSLWLSTAKGLIVSSKVNGLIVATLEYPEPDVKSARDALKELTDEFINSVITVAVKEDKGYRYELGIGREASRILSAEAILAAISSELKVTGGGRGTYGSFFTSEVPEKVDAIIKRSVSRIVSQNAQS